MNEAIKHLKTRIYLSVRTARDANKVAMRIRRSLGPVAYADQAKALRDACMRDCRKLAGEIRELSAKEA